MYQSTAENSPHQMHCLSNLYEKLQGPAVLEKFFKKKVELHIAERFLNISQQTNLLDDLMDRFVKPSFSTKNHTKAPLGKITYPA